MCMRKNQPGRFPIKKTIWVTKIVTGTRNDFTIHTMHSTTDPRLDKKLMRSIDNEDEQKKAKTFTKTKIKILTHKHLFLCIHAHTHDGIRNLHPIN